MPIQYRQGDVLLVKVDRIPRGLARKSSHERIVLACGEVTGHAHAISTAFADLFSGIDLDYYIDVKPGAVLTHEEHSPINIAPGYYKVIRQREYHPVRPRPVAD